MSLDGPAPDDERRGSYAAPAPNPVVWKERLLTALPPLLRLVRPRFTFDGKSYPYFYHSYNRTVRNERCVEIPIALDWKQRFRGRRILEVGHVLGHYGHGGHDVVDKYEPAPQVIHVDIADFVPPIPYDFIVSVSTLEHVGWDERPRTPAKILAVLAHLQRVCLAPGGTLLATLPVGYNAFLDAALRAGTLPFSTCRYLRRVSKWAHWEECAADAALPARYDAPYPGANAVVVGILAS